MIKVAQIGTSRYSHGNDIFNCIRRNSHIFEFVGYAMPENEREKFPSQVQAFEGYREYSVEEILNNPEVEAVVIETEEVYLTKYAAMAALKGKHIHMEKPGGTSLAEFEELIDIVKKNKLVLHMGYMYRYNPCVKELIRKVKSGELGEIISVEAQMSCYYDREKREWLKSFPGGIMFFLGCHLVDLILQMQGSPENIISLNKSTGTDGKDFGMAAFEYKNGVSVAKVSAVEVGGFARRQLIVSGTKATIELKPLEMFAEDGMLYTTATEYKDTRWEHMGERQDSAPFDRYNDMMLDFARIIKGEKTNSYTHEYEIDLYKKVLQACGEK